MSNHHIAHWIFDLGLGGDAKNLVSLANEQTKWARISILTQEKLAGVRANDLNSQVEVFSAMIPSNGLSDWISANQPDVLIVHRNGAPNPIETAVVELFCKSGIKCFEYNTFARVDPATDHLWAGHCHLSRASLTQYARRRALSPLDLVNHKAVGYAVGTISGITGGEKEQARRILNVPSDSFVVARVVRPDLRKWDPMPVLAVSRLLQEKVPAYLLVRAAPPERYSWLHASLNGSVGLLEPSVVEADVRNTLAASDVVVNYSVIGETFGLALAEAMMCGLPVIVNSTPHMDNAQIELCRHNHRGLVANTVSSLAAALKYLYENPEQGKTLGHLGRSFVENTFSPQVVEARLRKFLINQMQSAENSTESGFPEPTVEDKYELTSEWLDEYNTSQSDSFVDSADSMERFSDNWQLQLARFQDSLLYARKIGLSGTMEKLARRLSQGSVLRN